ncbi:MAG: phosphoribosylformylglycinamidine synthase subunit PurS [Elusimicrobiales bacterium]|nr:phosphoribosylformylglycinamidine synthase subunit PurS [Elusimicrobiales bacterium]
MIIEIWTKEKYAKNEEEGFIGRMAHAGLRVKAARLSRLYRVEGDFSRAEFDRLGTDLLADPITEKYSLAQWKPGLKGAWRVEVWLKDSVTDVVGESVKGAIADVLGREPQAVRFGRAYYAACESEAKLKHAVVKTLVNEIVNKFKIEKI